ncbi:hypothetical protein Cflav_PD5414 [Pedosphaera parvula Ellin514]|uniref:Uncharacterized protein n=1 Tax=Pedosphaera parvula (strain Ellin514) TaxID=320771 RepID=B9XB94_PEDPL|nr:hypothetical protein Cflav_PD5414 [Pedosphaera parvula Ellin514]
MQMERSDHVGMIPIEILHIVRKSQNQWFGVNRSGKLNPESAPLISFCFISNRPCMRSTALF